MTTCSLYKHGTELVGTVDIPETFPNLPDVLQLGDEFYRNVSLREEAGKATYWLATFRKIPPAEPGDGS